MRHLNWTGTAAVLLLLSEYVIALETREADPLFRSNDILEVTITAPVKKLRRERPTEQDLDGTLSYTDEAGTLVELDIGLRARGNYRRQKRVCPFPPIRLNIRKPGRKDSLFDKQKRIKLVTHCRNSSNRYQQVILREFLAYRFFNALSDNSYRVRLLQITYIDSDIPGKKQKQFGFLIEHRNRVARRIGVPAVMVPKTTVNALDGAYTNLMSVFQLFIGNTDFSPIAGAAGENCCHNVTLFGNNGEPWYAMPYDFDMAGMSDAPYATPNPKFRLRSVRQRLYRGRCENNRHLPATLQAFRDKQQTFVSMVENMQELNGSSKTSMLYFIDRFYKLINDPGNVQKKIVEACV